MFVTMILSRVRAYMRYRETVRELSRLSDHELSDIGLARSEIDAIARAG
ncbi:DUF1127 domain-containing protein [Salinarimonas soli]|uniref:DUF1127 domain-containing protein n=1 Tax=Salinarimonas soli TaxID=1638099 RepID=A0A5B2V9J2_9HYPH|nr:DUF1127 domain-containing protein [Salinarimonas soli]KAA2235378.1 DUF1127 domain-containing protein [Salinarimonas soli]